MKRARADGKELELSPTSLDFEGVRLELERVPCDLCGGTSFRELWSRMRHGLDLPTQICERCGLVQTNPRPTPTSNRRFYETLYPRFHGRDNENDPKWVAKSDRMAARRLSMLTNEVSASASARVLEIGCGAGAFLSAAKRSTAWSVRGIDPGEQQVRRCTSNGLDVARAMLDDLDDPPASFDVVASFHVLEHALSPKAFLRKAWQLLRPGGHLFLEVPDIMHPGGSLTDFLQLPHLCSFWWVPLNNYLLQVGFDAVYMSERSNAVAVIATRGEGGAPRPITRFDIDAFVARVVRVERVQRLARLLPSVSVLGKVRASLQHV